MADQISPPDALRAALVLALNGQMPHSVTARDILREWDEGQDALAANESVAVCAAHTGDITKPRYGLDNDCYVCEVERLGSRVCDLGGATA